MRLLLLLVCLGFLPIFGLLNPAMAQKAPPPRDTAYAVHNLFRERRRGALQGASLGLASVSGAVFEVVNHQPRTAAGITLITAFFTVLDIRMLHRYSESREGLLVRQYELGWPLPPDIRRRLRAKHFKALK